MDFSEIEIQYERSKESIKIIHDSFYNVLQQYFWSKLEILKEIPKLYLLKWGKNGYGSNDRTIYHDKYLPFNGFAVNLINVALTPYYKDMALPGEYGIYDLDIDVYYRKIKKEAYENKHSRGVQVQSLDYFLGEAYSSGIILTLGEIHAHYQGVEDLVLIEYRYEIDKEVEDVFAPMKAKALLINYVAKL